MNVNEMFEVFNDTTDTLSTQVRYVDYGFIAVIWIMCGQKIECLMDNGLILLFVVLSLAFDIAQYIWKSLTVWILTRRNEVIEQKTRQKLNSYVFPNYIHRGTWAFFILKVLSTITAAVMLVIRIIQS